MVTPKFSPVLSELPYGYIPAAVYMTGVTADADGWYYAPGQPVAISSNETVKKAGAADKVIGVLTDGITNDEGTPVPEIRVNVALFRGKRVDVAIASETLAAGDEVYITYQGKAAKVTTSPLAGTVSGATCSTPIPAVHGMVWKGGAANAEVSVIIY